MEKVVLDACCGGRMMWFDKKNPGVLYVDVRRGEKGFMKVRPSFEVVPNKGTTHWMCFMKFAEN